eukprot:COSAG02_NODE_4125_length_5743_cov_5.905741_10_plen_138_part_00
MTYWRDKKVEEEQAKDAPAEKPGSVEAERVAAKRLERIAKEKEERDPQMRQLNELIRLAQQHDLPGVDPNSISVRTSTRQQKTCVHSTIFAAFWRMDPGLNRMLAVAIGGQKKHCEWSLPAPTLHCFVHQAIRGQRH